MKGYGCLQIFAKRDVIGEEFGFPRFKKRGQATLLVK